MRKWVAGDQSIADAYKRKTERELSARGISLKPDVVVGKVEPEVIKKPVLPKKKPKLIKIVFGPKKEKLKKRRRF